MEERENEEGGLTEFGFVNLGLIGHDVHLTWLGHMCENHDP